MTASTKTQLRRWLRLSEAAEYTGFGERTLRRRIADGTITGYRVGPREIRVDADELDRMFRPIPTTASGGGRVA